MVTQASTVSGTGARRVWVLECHRAGDRAQTLGLAHALSWPFELKRIAHRWYEFFPNMLLEGTLLGVDSARSTPLQPPWPDLVISAGRMNENVAKWIRRQSGGRTRIVLVGRGWTRPGTVDLVIATPQYRLKPHPKLLLNELPLYIVDPGKQERAAERWAPRWSELPRPWIAVLVGGSSGPYLFDAATAARLGREGSAVARHCGGSLLITTSSRTRPTVVPALREAVDAPAFLHEWRRGEPDNPYPALLGLADRLARAGARGWAGARARGDEERAAAVPRHGAPLAAEPRRRRRVEQVGPARSAHQHRDPGPRQLRPAGRPALGRPLLLARIHDVERQLVEEQLGMGLEPVLGCGDDQVHSARPRPAAADQHDPRAPAGLPANPFCHVLIHAPCGDHEIRPGRLERRGPGAIDAQQRALQKHVREELVPAVRDALQLEWPAQRMRQT